MAENVTTLTYHESFGGGAPEESMTPLEVALVVLIGIPAVAIAAYLALFAPF